MSVYQKHFSGMLFVTYSQNQKWHRVFVGQLVSFILMIVSSSATWGLSLKWFVVIWNNCGTWNENKLNKCKKKKITTSLFKTNHLDPKQKFFPPIQQKAIIKRPLSQFLKLVWMVLVILWIIVIISEDDLQIIMVLAREETK